MELAGDGIWAWVALVVNGLGLGSLAGLVLLPVTIFAARHGRQLKGGRAILAMLGAGIAFTAVPMGCLYESFKLASSMSLPRERAFTWLAGLSVFGYAVPNLLVMFSLYDWASQYDVQLLRTLARKHGLRALVGFVVAGILAMLLPPPLSGLIVVIAFAVIGTAFGVALEPARKPRPKT